MVMRHSPLRHNLFPSDHTGARHEGETLTELFQENRIRWQEKRRINTEESTRILTERGVFFTSHNNGGHLIVCDRWDFFPATGKFNERRGHSGHAKRTGRGVLNLIQLIEEDGDVAATAA